MKHGFRCIERNYLRKWGEIDLILMKQNVIHFVEVKTVSCENIRDVSYETGCFRPEENIHSNKLMRLGRAIQTYLLEKGIENSEWQLDAAIVYVDRVKKEARVRMIKNVII